MTLQRLFAEFGYAATRDLLLVLVLVVGVAGAAYALAGLGPTGVLGVMAIAFVAHWSALRATAGQSPIPTSPAEGMRLLVSLILKWLILSFLAIMTLLAVTLCTLAIMAGAGFDFEASGQGGEAAEVAMAAFQATPGWQLAQVVALLAALLMAGAIARGMPVGAASLQTQRVVAMEVFNSTRKQAARLLLLKLAVLYAPIGLIIAVGIASEPSMRAGVYALGVGFTVVCNAILSTASHRWTSTAAQALEPKA